MGGDGWDERRRVDLPSWTALLWVLWFCAMTVSADAMRGIWSLRAVRFVLFLNDDNMKQAHQLGAHRFRSKPSTLGKGIISNRGTFNRHRRTFEKAKEKKITLYIRPA